LFIVRRELSRGALGFAQRRLFVLLSLFLFAACACLPRPVGPISSVIWLECHEILVMRLVDFFVTTSYMQAFATLPVLVTLQGPEGNTESIRKAALLSLCGLPVV
jgi:hypothetical protein